MSDVLTPDSALSIDALDTPPPTRLKRVVKSAAWIGFAIFCLFVFTLFKFPEERIRAYVDGTIHTLLAPRGMSLQAEESRIGLLFGLSYTMKRAQLRSAGQDAPLTIERIRVSPSLLSLAIGNLSGSFGIENAGGSLEGSFSMPLSEAGGEIKVDAEASQLDVGKLGLLKALAGFSAGGTLNGRVKLKGDLNIPSSLDGYATLSIKKLVMEPQNIAGFSIPRVAVPEATIDLLAEKGKLQFKTLKFANGGDLWGSVTGNIGLGKQWDSSTLELKPQFGISESVLKSFVLLDALLGAGKQADGTYSFVVGGTLGAPFPNPAGP